MRKQRNAKRKEADRRGPRLIRSSGSSRTTHLNKHDIRTARGCDFCITCGRVSKHNSPLQQRDNVWRAKCAPRPLFARALAQGHKPVLFRTQAFRLQAWACSTCPWKANSLVINKCHSRCPSVSLTGVSTGYKRAFCGELAAFGFVKRPRH